MDQIHHPQLLRLKRIPDLRGNLTVLEQGCDVPFGPQRVYWIYDVPGGERRYGHAYRRNRELIVALTGSFDVHVDTGCERETYHLNRSYYAVYVPAGCWREITNFSTGAVALVLASEPYDEADYLRDYNDFEQYAEGYKKTVATEPCRPATTRPVPGVDGRSSTLDDVRLLHPEIHRTARQGNLCVIQGGRDVDFNPSRAFYLYDVPAGAARGQHAHRCDHEVIVAVSGSFTVALTDGRSCRTYNLKRPFEVLHVPPGMWIQLHDFSGGSVALVMCANGYDTADYLNGYDAYLDFKQIPTGERQPLPTLFTLD